MNCFYCDAAPSNKINLALNTFKSRGHVSKKAVDTGLFIYNGLDRINNDICHMYDNLVACCWRCNASKRNNSLNDFLSWISNLRSNSIWITNV